MFWHVYHRAIKCPELSRVILATDDDRILSAAERWHIPAVMTRSDHLSGTDRVVEAADLLKVPDTAVVVNIQGDEPALAPAMLSQLLAPFSKPAVRVTTLARPIDAMEAQNADRVKVVFSHDHEALYFSRAPIPYPRGFEKDIYYGHIGLYAFRLDALKAFAALRPCRLEAVEKLEQLRLLENHIPLHVVVTQYQSIGVDTPQDIKIIENILKKEHTGDEKLNDRSL
jgi:3-deoxy-manno-octulosonate cytidylyltransferase (CMP-KDO synthetase)